MGKSRESLEQELSDLQEEYDSHYEATRDIMAQIHMVESDIANLEEED